MSGVTGPRTASGADVVPLIAAGQVDGEDAAGRGATVLTGCAIVLMVTFALSAWADGYYDFTVWAPLGLALCAGLVALLFGLRLLPQGWPAVLSTASLSGLAAWTAISLTWTDPIHRGWIEANRWGVYAVVFLLGVLAAASERAMRASLQAGALVAGASVVLMWTQLLAAQPGELFVDFRLAEPVGYINGQAGFLLITFWLLIALAERPGSSWRQAAGAGGAGLAATLLVLTQSRSVLPAILLSAVAVGLLVPRRSERLLLWFLVAITVAASLPWLLDVYAERASSTGSSPSDAVVEEAALVALAASASLAGAWGFAVWLAARLPKKTKTRVLRWGTVLVASTCLIVAVVTSGTWIERVERGYDEFIALADEPVSEPRFVSGGGYRYDMWRVAWQEFADSPWRGGGAAAFEPAYYRKRARLQEARQPHSLELQLLSELGLPGGVMFAAFVVGVIGAGLLVGRAAPSADLWTLAASLGIFIAWLGQTSVDWLHNIPGLSAVALFSAGMLAGRASRDGPRVAASRTVVGAAVLSGLALVLTLSLARQYVGEWHRENGQSVLVEDPREALRDSYKSLDFNAEAPQTFYLQAAAFARLNDSMRAKASLLDAAEREPLNFVTWALLGDLSIRLNQPLLAIRYYRRAHRLNPLDPALARHARAKVVQ